MLPVLPEPAPEQVLRGDRAGLVTTACFDVDLRLPTATSDPEPQRDAGAHAAGYAAGWAEGRRAAEAEAHAAAKRTAEAAEHAAAEHAARVEQAVAALAAAARRLDQRATPVLEELEQTIATMAFTLAEAIVGRELATAAAPGADAVARALSAAPADRPVTVRLHPADLATVTRAGAEAESGGAGAESGGAGRPEPRRTVTLVADPSLRPGDAVAECGTTTFESRLADALERVRTALLTGEEVAS